MIRRYRWSCRWLSIRRPYLKRQSRLYRRGKWRVRWICKVFKLVWNSSIDAVCAMPEAPWVVLFVTATLLLPQYWLSLTGQPQMSTVSQSEPLPILIWFGEGVDGTAIFDSSTCCWQHGLVFSLARWLQTENHGSRMLSSINQTGQKQTLRQGWTSIRLMSIWNGSFN